MQEIAVEVRCYGCGEQILKPADSDMELFRLGVPVHQRPSCLERANDKLEQDAVFEREQRRQRDYDDGITWPDDH